MKDVIVKWAMQMALPTIIGAVQDMIRSADYTGMRDRLISKLTEMAEKTKTPIDNNLVERVIPIFFAPEFLAHLLSDIVPPVRAFIAHSETKWDDKTLLPVLDTLENMLGQEPFKE